MSENGSRITKLIDSIKGRWRIMDIPNASIDLVPIFSVEEKTFTIYSIGNMKKLYREKELEKFKKFQI